MVDCDDLVLHLARDGAGERSELSLELREHVHSCEGCTALVAVFDEDASPALEDALIGEVIGAYEIRELLGKGGMGRVYLATHPEIGSQVAIKVFSKDWNTHQDLVSRFFAEARATNLIGHENIVNILDVGRLDDGRPFMVMEHLKGQPLSKLIRNRELRDATTVRVLLDVLSALAAAHERNIIHRDLKPDNIFVSPEGRATLLDFGIAKLVPEAGSDGPAAATATGLVLGTPAYMSPEQAIGDPVDHRTDIYALGVVLYECVTGRRPFVGSSLYRVLDQQIKARPPSPRSLRPDLSDALEALIMRALAKEPGERHQSAAEMRSLLADCSVDSAAGPVWADAAEPSEHHGTSLETSSSPRQTAVSPEDEAPTAATVMARPVSGAPASPPAASPPPVSPPTAPPPPTPSVPNTSHRTKLAAGVLVALAACLVIWASRSSSPNDNRSVAPAWDGSPHVAAPHVAGPLVAGPLDAAVHASTDAGLIEARPSPDARLAPDAGAAPRMKPPRKRPSGIAPLAQYQAAAQAARDEQPDAMLARITIRGLGSDGRVRTATAQSEVAFHFMSQSLVARAQGRAFSRCALRVIAGPNLRAEHVTTKCKGLTPVPPPRCSMAELLREAHKKGSIPTSFQDATAVYRMSRTRRPRAIWMLTTGGVNYDLPPCP